MGDPLDRRTPVWVAPTPECILIWLEGGQVVEAFAHAMDTACLKPCLTRGGFERLGRGQAVPPCCCCHQAVLYPEYIQDVLHNVIIHGTGTCVSIID
jgi:hypothetical protein